MPFMVNQLGSMRVCELGCTAVPELQFSGHTPQAKHDNEFSLMWTFLSGEKSTFKNIPEQHQTVFLQLCLL